MNFNHQLLLESLVYDKETGQFTWLARPRAHFSSDRGHSVFNALYARKPAGDVSPEGYVVIRLFGKNHKAHRLAWMYENGEMPTAWLDHINRKRSDNRLTNLRLATPKLNAENASIRSDNKSGEKGVSWHRKSNSWVAQISNHRKVIHIGCFKSIAAAASARKAAELQLFTGSNP